MAPTYNYVYMLGGLLLLILVTPVAEQFLQASYIPLVSDLAGLATLIGIWSLSKNRKWFQLGCGLALGAVVCTGVSVAADLPVAKMFGQILILIFCGLGASIALRDVFHVEGAVGTNQIMGAVCVYLLFGVIWAILYQLVESLSPGSFKGLESFESGQPFVYYSFVTLTTLGYGDIGPVRPAAMALAYMEAVFGQFYLAVLVAGLVGMRLAGGQPRGAP